MAGQIPRYTHGCEACTYLGSKTLDGEYTDFYRHPHETDPNLDSYVGRIGNGGPEYWSYPAFSIQMYWHYSLRLMHANRYLQQHLRAEETKT